MSSKNGAQLKSRTLLKAVPRANLKLAARDVLLEAAKHMFARKGLNGTTIRDIAEEAGMNSAQISYYFEGKEGLYRACLEHIGDTELQMAKQILTPPRSHEEFRIRLHLFAENMFHQFLQDRDAGLIIIREYDRVQSPAGDIFKKHFLGVLDVIASFFKAAQKKGFSKDDRDPFILMNLFFGMIMSELRLDHVKEAAYGRTLKKESERKKVLAHIVALFTE
jgi:AcrR family transcriptional regulator